MILVQHTKDFFYGNGFAREFTLSYPAPDPAVGKQYIYLVISDRSGRNSEPVLSNFRVARHGETISVVYPVTGEPLALGKKLTIYRKLPLIQPTDLENGDNFYPETIEDTFDWLEMQIQELQEESDRAIKVPISSDQTPEDLLQSIFDARDETQEYWRLIRNALDQIAGVASDSLVKVRGGTAVRALGDKLGEIVGVKDFGARGAADANDTASFQAAVDAISAAGGGTVHAPGDYYRLDGMVTLKDNVHLAIGRNTVIDCSRSTQAYAFYAHGGFGAEAALAATVTSGDKIISTVTPHGFAAGDWVLLKSQRACLHDDAGPEWRLGETTANALSPFFAEPLQVDVVMSATQFSVCGGILFPDYRPDRTQETYAQARDSATVQKIEFVQGISITGGRFIKSDHGKSLIDLRRCYKPELDITDMELGHTAGVGVLLRGCLSGHVKARASRPPDWSLVGDQSAYNSYKDIGSWFCAWDVEDLNGCQGWDQTFESGGHPSICPTLRMKSIDSHRDGATTHGGCYGADIDIYAVRPGACGFRNRARFTRITVRVIDDGSGAQAGLLLSAWGALDCIVHDAHFTRTVYGIDVGNVGTTATAPAECNLTISNCHFDSVNHNAIFIRERADNNTELSNIVIRDITMRDCERGIVVGSYVHGVNIDGVTVSRMRSAAAYPVINFQTNTAAGKIANVTGNNIGSQHTLIRVQDLQASAVRAVHPVSCWIDDATIFLHGAGTKYDLNDRAGYISASGDWTPTITTIANATIGSLAGWRYSIVRDVATFSGYVQVTAPATGSSRCYISPAPNTVFNFGVGAEANGVGAAIGADAKVATIIADATAEKLVLEWYATAANETKIFRCAGQYFIRR